MIICSRCGTQNPPDAADCLVCGSALSVPPPPPPAATSDGEPETPAAADEPEPVRHPAPLGQTLALPAAAPEREEVARDAAPAVEPPEEAPPAARPASKTLVMVPQGAGGGLRSTVLGLGLPDLQNDSGKPAPMPAAGPGGTLIQTRAAAFHGKTMLGLAPDDLAARAIATSREGANAGAAAPAQPHTRTILGIARPGIAPMNPGVQKTDAADLPFPAPPPPPPPPEGAARITDPARALVSVPPHTHLPTVPVPNVKAPPGARTMTLRAARKNSVFGVVAIGAAALLLLLGGALYFYFASPENIEARVVLDPEGRERILLRCARCPDGTVVRLGGIRATFKAQQASLDVPHALKVGETPFTLGIRAPDSQREKTVSLSVRIDYRVRADLAGLSEPAPKVRVLVDAIPGSLVSVDDRPVALSAAGQARVDFDVTRELTGLDGSVRRLERQVTYAVTPQGGSKQTGQVIVQLGIVPLIVDAPGATITIEGATFVLAGRTAKGGNVTVEGRPLRVDPEGRFAQVMNVSSVGETTITVRAVAPEHAPRLFPIRVRRVTSFADEALKLRSQATTSYASIATDIEKKRGWKVALDGTVLERSNVEHSTVLLFEATSGCRAAPCLARITYGARTNVVAGERLSVFGEVQGSVDGPRRGTKIPEILADFVVKGKR